MPDPNPLPRRVDSPTDDESASESGPGVRFEHVYDELRGLARRHMAGERKSHSLQATALVHEVYVKLLGDLNATDRDDGEFYRHAAVAMRRILIDHARKHARPRRGGDRLKVTLDAADLADPQNSAEILAVDEAIERLSQVDERAAEVVRLRFFAGLEVAETARAMGMSERSVHREWAFAKAWLAKALADE
jgi:RNA polymerase sigma factor (TIGR02999 family)